jgi:hypothetical protein
LVAALVKEAEEVEAKGDLEDDAANSSWNALQDHTLVSDPGGDGRGGSEWQTGELFGYKAKTEAAAAARDGLGIGAATAQVHSKPLRRSFRDPRGADAGPEGDEERRVADFKMHGKEWQAMHEKEEYLKRMRAEELRAGGKSLSQAARDAATMKVAMDGREHEAEAQWRQRQASARMARALQDGRSPPPDTQSASKRAEARSHVNYMDDTKSNKARRRGRYVSRAGDGELSMGKVHGSF